MKSLILSVAMLLSASAFAAGAEVEAVPSPATPSLVTCAISFGVRIESFLLVTRGYGNAIAVCTNPDGNVSSRRNLTVEVEGIGPGLGVFELQGQSQTVLLTHARDFRGTYNMVESNVAIGDLLGAPYFFNGNGLAPSYYAGLRTSGLGVRLTGTTWTIR